jgi:hypothetical protein
MRSWPTVEVSADESATLHSEGLLSRNLRSKYLLGVLDCPRTDVIRWITRSKKGTPEKISPRRKSRKMLKS